MRIALGAHCAGVVLALLLAWFIPAVLRDMQMHADYVAPVRFVLVLFALGWGGWKGMQIVRGKDALSNETQKYFDGGK